MTACRQWLDPLLDSALEALSTTAARSLEDHLRQCPACAAAAADLLRRRQQMDAALTQLVSAAEPSSAFGARVRAAAEASIPATLWPPAWVGALAGVALLVAAAVLLPTVGERWEAPARSQLPALSLSDWRAPTDNLLPAGSFGLLGAAPRLGEFYFPLDSLSALPLHETGGKDNEG